jgi:hypothetical protein
LTRGENDGRKKRLQAKKGIWRKRRRQVPAKTCRSRKRIRS